MSEPLQEPPRGLGDCERMFVELVDAGMAAQSAAEGVAEAYLDRKPRQRGKHRVTNAERDAAFWSGAFLRKIPGEAWLSEPLLLALVRYMGQEPVANGALLEHIATLAPEAVRRAVPGLVPACHIHS